MKLATSDMIRKIDNLAESDLGISVTELMRRAGVAVASAVRELTRPGGRVIVLSGTGNNGGDGYAAACELMGEYRVAVVDVLGIPPKTPAAAPFVAEYTARGGEKIALTFDGTIEDAISSADTVVDAIFGTGVRPDSSVEISHLAELVRSAAKVRKVAVDLPLGVNPDDGSIIDFAVTVDTTVALSYIKPGLLSFPARTLTGRIVLDRLGIDTEITDAAFEFKNYFTDADLARSLLPSRPENSNKGSFGKALVITGSEKYRGAAHLSLEAALRGGAGLVAYLGIPSLADELTMKYPEAIYLREDVENCQSEGGVSRILDISTSYSSILIGSGSSPSPALYRLVEAMILTEGAPVVLDADAINSIAAYGDGTADILKRAKRAVILTPHPLEFARLSGKSVTEVQAGRLNIARKFAYDHNCILLLKGAATVVTDGNITYLNGTGSSALAKAGSGDVLAGLLVSILAQGVDPLAATALAAYLHGAAGDGLAECYSHYGVTPSDLPREIAKVIASLAKK